MAQRHDVSLRGLIQTYAGFTYDALDRAEMTLSEAGPLPGSPVARNENSDLSAQVSGGQAVKVNVFFTSAGWPGVDPLTSARAAWKKDSEPDTEWRGWSPPTAPHTARAISSFVTTTIFSTMDIGVIPEPQVAVMISSDQSGATMTGPRSQTLAPSTWELTDNGPVRPLLVTVAARSSCLIVVPDGSVLCVEYATTTTPAPGFNFWVTYQSRDNGATWPVVARNSIPLDTGAPMANTILRGTQVGNNVLMVHTGLDGGVQTLRQYTSTSGGFRFTQVGPDWAGADSPQFLNVDKLRAGLAIVVYFDAVDVIFKRLGSSAQSIETAPRVVIEAAPGFVDGIAMEVDSDDSIWVRYFAAGSNHTHMFVSYNGGVTWQDARLNQDLRGPWDQGENTSYLRFSAGATAGGRHLTLCNSVDSAGGANFGGVAMLQHWGGWANLELLGDSDSGGATGNNWIPVQLPESTVPWTVSGTGTFVLTPPGYGLYTTTGDTRRHTYANVWGATKHDVIVDFEVDVISGVIDTVGWIGLQSDGVLSVLWAVSVTATQISIIDNMTPGTPVAHGVTGILQVAWYYNAATDALSVWYRDSETPGNWTKSHDAVPLTPFALVAVGTLIRGHFAASNAVSRWYGHNAGWSDVAGSYAPAAAQLDLVGRTLSATPYPINDAGTPNAGAFLSAQGGPAIKGEIWDITPNSTHGLARSFPLGNPSPSEPWRTLTVADPEFDPVPEAIPYSWDLGQPTILHEGSFALVLLDTNVPTAEVRGWDGGGWVVLGTYDGRIVVPYVRDGNVVTPGVGATAGRYLFRGELNGAEVDLGSNKRRVVDLQTEGPWDESIQGRKARIFLRDADGTEPVSGTMTIIPRNGVLVVHNHTTTYSKYQVRVPSTLTATGWIQIGWHQLGPVHVVGKQWSEGHTWDMAPNVRTVRSSKGTATRSSTGPPIKTYSVDWTDTTNHCGLRSGDPDWLAAGEGVQVGGPLATRDDVGWWFMAMLEEWQSGETPLLLLTAVPKASGTTVTDPTGMMPCYLASSVGISNVTGDTDGSPKKKEVQRHPSVTFAELV